MDAYGQSVKSRLAESISPDALENDENTFRKAVACFLLEDYDHAHTLLAELTSKRRNVQYLLNFGYLLYQKRQYREALRAFRELIEISPYYIEAYLNATKTCLAMKDYPLARKFCNAAQKLAPDRPDVKKAISLYYLETGELKKFFSAVRDIPDKSIFSKPSDNDISRLQNNASIVVGANTVSVLIVVFSNVGIRTVILGYKDENNVFPRPDAHYKWYPLTPKGRESITIECIEPDHNERVALIGYRAIGLETHEMLQPAGFFITDFFFPCLDGLHEENYVGLFLVDYDKKLRLEPKQIFVRDLQAIPEGDLIDLYQDMIYPSGTYSITGIKEPSEMRAPRVFLAYAREDREDAEYIFRELKKKGVDVWKDDKSLKVGELFEYKIDTAIEEADFAIVCLSSKSVNKIGFVQREFRQIVEALRYRPSNIPFALPVKLDDCLVPREFEKYHWKEFTPDKEKFLNELAEEIVEHYRVIIDSANE